MFRMNRNRSSMSSGSTCLPFCRTALSRRSLLLGGAAFLTAARAGATETSPSATAGANISRFDDLVAFARQAADTPHVPPVVPAPALIEKVDYRAHWQIRFREDKALYPGGPDAPVQLFHPGRYFPEPVDIHLREADGSITQVPFSAATFDMPEDSPALDLPPGFGFAGFRVMRPGMGPDWVSFLGASYFRTDGPERQYGLSARGIAVDTGLNKAEEFPRFTAFWIGPPEADGFDVSVWAMLDGPSITGAYRFDLKRGASEGSPHLTRVSAHLFMRADVERLGVAPLTSMYWYSERDRFSGRDWRPEIHDSDGLSLATGAGERIWRPLGNPPSVSTSSFFDDNPRGFGLIQRDRDFGHYQDDGVFYDRRPSAWVRPRGDWGRGAVQLIEIPTDDETFDNIVAYWIPERPARTGESFTFEYDIEWRETDPQANDNAIVVATRQGQGGIPGNPIPPGVGKMVVDFAGPALEGLDTGSGVEPVLEAVNGSIVEPFGAYRVQGTNLWRLAFDFRQTGSDPVSLRAFLRRDGKALTETWMADAWAQL